MINNIEEVEKKLLQQFKDSHQKSLSEDSLCSKLISKFDDIDADEIDHIKNFLTSNGITITETYSNIEYDEKEYARVWRWRFCPQCGSRMVEIKGDPEE